MALFDIKKVKADAEAEFKEEKLKAAKLRYKEKLALLDKAQKAVRNIERELEDLLVEINE